MFKHILKLLALSTLALPLFAVAATDLADKPLLTGNSVPGNVAITISAEFPTALTYAYTDTYATSNEYLGYFDPNKCYTYDTVNHYFIPNTVASSHTCSGQWSGNFLNWSTMQSLDPFRQTLTGGNRVVDTDKLTVLEKAWSSGQGSYKNRQKAISTTTLIQQSTPFYKWSNFYIRIDMLGNRMWYSGSTSPNITTANTLALVDGVTVVADTTADSSKAAANKIYEKYTRVKVCDATVGLESSCFQYPKGNYKPIGLIQKNPMKLRFAAFGYLADPTYKNDDGFTGSYTDAGQTRNQNLQGGVLRAKMASLGPLKPDPGKPSADNAGPTGTSEWDADTGVFEINPDPNSASTTATNNGIAASAVPNSGVINYLNKFGSTAGRYKVFDRTAELYYAATRYFKNLGNVAAYTDMVGYTAAEKQVLIDGFPVIKDWKDPVEHSCQANFIIGIGDNNTYTAGNLPGSKSTSGTVPPEVKNDKSVDVSIATNRVGALQGLGNIGDGSSFLMGGLAFDSHTRDIRSDFSDKQTIATYWLDVLEPPQGYVPNNQYVLATKFGGFDVPANYDPCSTSATSATCTTPPPATIPTTTVGDTTWDKNGDGKPDNYFEANNPAAMVSGLNNAFADILSKVTGSSNTFAVISPYVPSGAMSFATSYKADTWTGNVVGKTVTFTGNTPVETLAWNASEKLDAQSAGSGWDSARKIATSTCTADVDGTQQCVGTPFRPASLTSLLPNFAALPANQANAVNFLRGDASNTGSLGKASFRSRASLLGDIVNSKVVAVGPPRAPYTEDFNPGYIAFKNNPVNAARATVAYVGANDGMLHAFNGVPAGGNELFAYVPNALIKGPTNTPLVNGLAALAQPVYNHKYFVDATPAIWDVDFGVSDWHSVLIGGLGKGGKAYYALDVTNPAGITSEGILSDKEHFLWEFTHKNMGYSYGRPLVVKTKKHGWTVILTSGYNNADGKGYFFLVNPKTGALLEAPIPTGEGTTTNDAGLAHVNAFVADARDSLADAAYAGDALGNVWRLDLSGTGAIPAPKKIAAFGSTHPITVHPLIEIDQSTLKRYVYVGTGRILADSDVKSTEEQYFYAILDGTQTAPFLDGTEGKGPSTLPSGGSYPVTPLQMVDDTNTITTTGVIADNTKPMGYFIDLGTNGGSPYRVNVDMISSAGVVAFTANSLGGDACSPSGNNKLYAVTYGSGKSVIVDSAKTFLASFAGTGLATSISFFRPIKSGSTDTSISISDDTGKSGIIQINPSSATGFTPLNWRELPTSD